MPPPCTGAIVAATLAIDNDVPVALSKWSSSAGSADGR
jgi:hypothetical protein